MGSLRSSIGPSGTSWALISWRCMQLFWRGGALSASMRKGIQALLFKGGDRAELKNWCPLTLLTADYKVLAKVATLRLKQVMSGLVSEDLACIDQEKAFDRVQHGFLFGVLGRMGFGPRFLGWLRTLYKGVYSCVRVNVFLSRAVEQVGEVRQGCPLSPLFYVLFMELCIGTLVSIV
ncbi:hypothetical protein SKAU_G00387450 [Synaphobranchus kaupii]|uniref:Reverse transcriptase domain-containing protein n=1 Tax=Synaphobranchus kaupii TaxID=118154 RepID=A0A9Q1EAR8_SYNKA|nr:hypothetical protein SKAU_G00387450 [Synaphobranchus kaupii]